MGITLNYLFLEKWNFGGEEIDFEYLVSVDAEISKRMYNFDHNPVTNCNNGR